MRSSNPVLSRRGAFGAPQAGPQQQAPQPGAPYGQQSGANPFGGGAPYGQQQPSGGNPFGGAPQYGQPASADQLNQMYQQQSAGPLQTGRMTMDDVVAKTTMTLLTLIVFGALGWVFIPVDNLGAAVIASLIAFGVGMFVTFRRTVSPALVLAYSALQGIFLGAWSHFFELRYPGIVVQAVLGTAAVFAGMLWAYKSGRVRVTRRYARVGMAIAFAFLAMILVNLVVLLIGGGNGLGLREGPIGILFALVGIGLGAFFLSLDFNEAEQLVAVGAPEREAWRVAFGLTLSLVWIYMEIVRLLSILRD
ncbi:Bax inhibitor-1/YccA family protein [Yinghuangia soli]|uniref:Bax inhibitor-1/YccA family protein n=1 Tax=Yinghuangia soli TaxID=2908204 RepID=A0AA41U0B3_9ACTN|nr:Bax inhibitor-1/YccA family protein [Yinghuangia soli]MCF2528225.1 Bax inhibitor-1/YccA family protein [Yinghuangia soli]